MKKIYFGLIIALVLCSCAKTELTGVEAGEMIIGASMEVYPSISKAALSDTDGSLTWQTGDVIEVATSEGHAQFNLKTGAGTASATFGANYSGTLGSYATYPADIFDSESIIKIPASREWSEDNTNCSMFGSVDGDNVAFKHLGGVVKVTLNGVPANAKKFVFSTPGKKITGEFDLQTGTGTDTNKYIETADDSGTANSLYTLTFTLTQSRNMAFYIPLPCGTYPKFAFKLLGADESADPLYEFEGISAQTVNRKDILLMPASTIGAVPDGGYLLTSVPSEKEGEYFLPEADSVILYFEGKQTLGTDDVINLKYNGSSQLPKKLCLKVKNGNKVNISGELPNTHVEFDQGEIVTAKLKTSSTTFKIIAPAKISEKLVVKGGNVEITGEITGSDNVKAIEVEAGATADGSSAPVQITLENQAKVGIPEQGGEGGITTSANVVIVNNTDKPVNVTVPTTAPETVQVASAGTGTGEVKKDGNKVTTKPAAAIGTQNFFTLSDAINAAQDGQTITLVENVELSEPIVTGKIFTLTLNANISPVSTWGETYNNTRDALIIVKRGGDITINGTGEISSNHKNVWAAVKMTQNGETEEGDAAKLTVGGDVTLQGYYYGIVGNGSRHNTEITVNGGTFKAYKADEGQGIFQPQDGKLTINGGTFEAYESGIEVRGGTVEINGGTLTSTASPLDVDPNGSGSTTKGAALAIAQHTTKKDINVTVNGGTFNGYKAISVTNPQNNETDNVNVTYKAGTLNGGITLGHGTFNLDGNLAVKEPVKVIGKTTLNLGTSKLSAASGFTRNNTGVIIINRKGDLTVEGTTGSIESAGNVYTAITLTEKTVDESDTTVPAKLTVDGGNLIGWYYAIAGSGNPNRKNTSIVINGGTVTTGEEGGAAIYHPQNGTLTINGGTIESATGIYVKSGSVTTEVTGGIIKGTGEKEDYETTTSGMQSTGDAIVFDNCDYPGGAPNAAIKGGYFYSANASAIGSYAKTGKDPITGFISGGLFSSEPAADLIVEGKAAVENQEESTKATYPWTIGERPNVAKIGDTEYATLKEAFAAVPTDAAGATTITIINNANETFDTQGAKLNKGQKAVLDLNGYKLVGTSTKAGYTQYIYVENGGELTVKDSRTGGTIEYHDSYIENLTSGSSTGGSAITCHGCMTLESGTIENKTPDTNTDDLEGAIDMYTNAWGQAYCPADIVLNINGGVAKSNSSCTIRMTSFSAGSYTTSVTANMNGGEVYGRNGFFIQGVSEGNLNTNTLNLNGGKVYGIEAVRVMASQNYANESETKPVTIKIGKGIDMKSNYPTQSTKTGWSEGICIHNLSGSFEQLLSYVNIIKDGNYVAKIGSVGYETLEAAVNAATTTDVIELFEGEYTTYNTNFAKNKTLIFEGIEGKTIWRYGSSSTGVGEAGADGSLHSSNVTFKNITLADNGTANDYYRGFTYPTALTFENCTFKNMIGYLGTGDVHFNNCVFDVASVCEYAVKTYSGAKFYFDGCTFKGNNKANIQLYRENTTNEYYVQIKDCKFYRGTDKSRTAVYFYDPGTAGGAYWEIHLDGNNENLGEIAVNATSGSWLWGSMKQCTTGSKTKIYVGEKLVWDNGTKVE